MLIWVTHRMLYLCCASRGQCCQHSPETLHGKASNQKLALHMCRYKVTAKAHTRSQFQQQLQPQAGLTCAHQMSVAHAPSRSQTAPSPSQLQVFNPDQLCAFLAVCKTT